MAVTVHVDHVELLTTLGQRIDLEKSGHDQGLDRHRVGHRVARRHAQDRVVVETRVVGRRNDLQVSIAYVS